MLSFICILLWFLEIQFWERKFLVLISGDSGSEGFYFDIWGFPSGTAFHLGFWKSMRSMVMLRGAWSE